MSTKNKQKLNIAKTILIGTVIAGMMSACTTRDNSESFADLKSSKYRIRNPRFADNMHHFITKCVLVNAMKGVKYNAAELMASDDTWELVRRNADETAKVNIETISGRVETTCSKAATLIDLIYFPKEIWGIEDVSEGQLEQQILGGQIPAFSARLKSDEAKEGYRSSITKNSLKLYPHRNALRYRLKTDN